MRLVTKETLLQTTNKVWGFFFVLFAAVQINPWVWPLVCTGLRSMPWRRLPLAGTTAREALEVTMWKTVEVPAVTRIEASWISAFDGV